MVDPGGRAGWRRWLEANHVTSGSIWLVLWKKGSSGPYMSNDDVVEEALAFGWIDSLPRKLDAERSLLLLSPRKPGSAWSAVNKARVERMLAKGAMAPAGLAAIERSKADGGWSALDAVEALEVPPDLAAALAALPPAAETFAAFPRSAKRGILEWIVQAKTPATRAKRVAETAREAQAGRRANQWRQPAK
jgi:uncharacterized protein YdeI (YjbR/CyaY-like superfamily)